MVSRVLRHRAIGTMAQKIIPLTYVRRRGNAAVARLARGLSKAVPATVRGALDLSGHACPGVGCESLRSSDWSSLRRSASRRTSCWSLYAGTPVRRLQPVRPSRNRATETRSYWPLPPIVRDTPAFVAACRQGLVAAEAGPIVTFGITAERAATEYGFRRGSHSRRIRGEAGRGESRRIHQSRLSLEQRQLHVSSFGVA